MPDSAHLISNLYLVHHFGAIFLWFGTDLRLVGVVTVTGFCLFWLRVCFVAGVRVELSSGCADAVCVSWVKLRSES